MVKRYDIDFFRHDVANIKSLYVEIGENNIRTLSFGMTAVSTPHKGNIFFLENMERDYDFVYRLLETYKYLNSIYVLVNTPSFSLVPQPLFNIENKDTYVKELSEGFDDDNETTYCDFWKWDNLYLIYKIPKLINGLIQKAPYVNCYHLQTGLQYIVGKKSFIKFEDYVVVFFDGENRMYILACHNHKLVFAQSYVLDSPSDAHYYIEFCLQTFFANTTKKVQLLVFASTTHRIQNLVGYYRTKNHAFYVQVFSLDNIFRTYGITNPPLMSEDLFLLLLMSLCES